MAARRSRGRADPAPPRVRRSSTERQVGVAGYLTAAGVPLAGTSVRSAGPSARGTTRTAATATTDDRWLLRTRRSRPRATAAWTAAATGPPARPSSARPFRDLKVAPEVSHLARQSSGGRRLRRGLLGRRQAGLPGQPGARAAAERRLLAHRWPAARSTGAPATASRGRCRCARPPTCSARCSRRPSGTRRGSRATARLRVVVNAGG